MIPYVEILKWNTNKTQLQSFALFEPSQCWFELSYYELGQFEVYVNATLKGIEALQIGNYVRIPHKPYLWIITSVQYEYNAEGSRMIDVKGYEAKWVVSKRIIRDPQQLPTSLPTAMTRLFNLNLGSGAITQRRIGGLTYNFDALNGRTTDAQATRSNLWGFSSNLLKLHKCGMVSTLSNGKILVSAIEGQDKTESVIFSQSMDNLINSTYYSSDENYKTNCMIVSTFSTTTTDNNVRTTISSEYVAFEPNETQGGSGIDRSEMVIESNLSTKVTNASGEEVEIDPSSSTYQEMQKAEGKSALANNIITTEFNGEIDLQNSQYQFDIDFSLGDLVLVRDEYFGYSADARIHKYTFKQDESGYGEEAEYGD